VNHIEKKLARIGGFRRDLISISLVLALVLLMTFAAVPVLAPAIISWPEETMEVNPGENFTFRHRLRWDEAAPGFYVITIYWDYGGDNSWHFTFVENRAYFDNGDPIETTVSTSDNGSRYTVQVKNVVWDPRNGEFNVDLTLRASGPDGSPHRGGEHPISYVAIRCNEDSQRVEYPAPVTVRVPGRGVAVSISPSYQSGTPGTTLSYSITVTNTGTFDDTYDLTIGDTENWSATTSLASLTISAGGDETATLDVTIPSGALVGTEDTITVKATSRENAEIRASNTCTARALAAIVRGVEVSISPSYQSGSPGATLHRTVNVKNLGSIEDTFTFVVTSEADWSTSIEPTSLTLAAGATGEATLNVVVPPDAGENASMTVVVKATSTGDPTVSNSGTCETVARGETPEEPSPTVWPAVLAVLIAVIILVGGYVLYSISKAGQRKRRRTLRA